MATITINIEDRILPRILSAYNVETADDLKAEIQTSIKSKVSSYEETLASEQAQRTINQAREEAITIVETATQKVATEIIIS